MENTKNNPHSLLTRHVLETALKGDLGPQWNLHNFEIEDFTKKGENYACVVTGVSCIGVSNDLKKETFYVAKLNPLRQTTLLDETMNDVFIKEGVFFTLIAIKLNAILSDIGHPKICFPECVYHDFSKGREILLSRDLRKRGFGMYNKRTGMDLNHSLLLVKELAKLHSSSVILKNNISPKGILDLYPSLLQKGLEPGTERRKMFDKFVRYGVETSIKFIQKIKGYNKHIEWLTQLLDSVPTILVSSMKDAPETMKVINHGDCWNNNVLFRYDAQENPEQIALLDMQVCRYASLALDLNYFFYTSLTGEIRNNHYDHLLSVYYKEFHNILTAANIQMPFTEDDLRKEVREKALYGVLRGLMLIPVMLYEGDDAFDFDQLKDGHDVEEGMQGLRDTAFKMLETNLIFRPRFLSILDDSLKMGLIDE